MWKEFGTLRFRLTGAVVAIFAVLQVGLWVFVDVNVVHYFHQRFDADLLQHAQMVVEAINAEQRTNPGGTLYDCAAVVFNTFKPENVFVQVRGSQPDGSMRSPNLEGFELPVFDVVESGARAPDWRTLDGKIPNSLIGKGATLRLVTLFVTPPHSPPYFVQAASNLEPLERIVGLIHQLLILFIVVSILAAAIACWVVTGSSLAPLTRISKEAKRITIGHLDRRIAAKSTSREVGEMVRQINDMLGRFEEQFRNQQRFLSNVGHELKTPLAVLLGELQMQRRQLDRHPELAGFFENCVEEVHRLIRIVEGFLMLSRVRSQNRLETVRNVSLEDVVLSATQHSQREAKRAGVQVVPTFTSDADAAEPIVAGDADLLTAMTEHLLDNAIRHSPAGETIEVETRTAANSVTLYVRDRGPGIPQEYHDRVFEVYYQVPQSRLTGKAGIGLAIVKAVAELHGGRVSVHNRDQGGAEFVIKLALTDGDSPSVGYSTLVLSDLDLSPAK